MFEIMKNEGVQSVINIDIKNLTIDDGNYSPIAYNISIATQNNIVYPSKDPSIFEVKFPTHDIKGLVVLYEYVYLSIKRHLPQQRSCV